MFRSHTGIMARRLLINWRIRPDAAQTVLPKNFRPHLLHGHAIAGLCLVRLQRLRPAGLPASFGLSSENVALRIAATHDSPDGARHVVLILRRETSSAANHAFAKHAGFGVHHFAPIGVEETADNIAIRMHCPGQSFSVRVSPADGFAENSVFHTMPQAVDFFRGSEIGYSPSKMPGLFDAAKLQLQSWKLAPMRIHHARSSLINTLFPNAAVLDSAFIMRNIAHTWTALHRIALEFPTSAPQRAPVPALLPV